LVEALEMGGNAASVVAKLRELETRRDRVAHDIACLQPVPRLPVATVETRLAEWRRLLRQWTTQARAVLQRLLGGPLTFTPTATGYTFAGPTRLDKLFAGVVAPRPSFLQEGDLRGTEHIRPEDTLEVDYGLLLERAYGNGWRPQGSGVGTR
jgi:hypothetical protein